MVEGVCRDYYRITYASTTLEVITLVEDTDTHSSTSREEYRVGNYSTREGSNLHPGSSHTESCYILSKSSCTSTASPTVEVLHHIAGHTGLVPISYLVCSLPRCWECGVRVLILWSRAGIRDGSSTSGDLIHNTL